MLHAVAELAEHLVRDVERVLGDEVDADALGADQPHHLLDLLQQRLGRVVEQQVRLVEEEHELRLVEVADLGQLLEQLGEQPEQEGRVEPAALCMSLSAARMLMTPRPCASVCIRSSRFERGLAEEAFAALLLEREQAALDRADAGRRDVAVLAS